MSADYIVQRGKVWYFQLRLAKGNVQYSLRTKDYTQARWLAINIFREVVEVKKKQVTENELKILVKNFVKMVLDSMEFSRAQGTPQKIILSPLRMQSMAQGKNKSKIGEIFATACEMLYKTKFSVPEHKQLARLFITAFLQMSNIEKERFSGNYLNSFDAANLFSTSMPVPVDTPTKKTVMPLSELIKRYTAESKVGWTEGTLQDFTHTFETFAWILNELGYGDIDIGEITPEIMRAYKDSYIKLPRNLHQRQNCKGKTLKEILRLGIQDVLSPVTCNKNFITLGGMFIFAKKQGWTTHNYAEGLTIKNARRASVERAEYANEQIACIIKDICIAKYRRKPENLWIPVISAYTGMRLGEVCQLRASDIACKDNIWYFSVNEQDDKTLKTKSSTRIIPVHAQLISTGILTFISESQKDHPLFPKIIKQAPKFNKWQKWYAYLNRKLFPNETVVFHSFRHAFINSLKQADCKEQIIAELAGHKTGSITLERYGKKYNLEKLSEAVAKLDYGFKLTDFFTYKGKGHISITPPAATTEKK